MTDQKQKPAPLQQWQLDAIAAEPRGFYAGHNPGVSPTFAIRFVDS
jgi:hypothetical protein